MAKRTLIRETALAILRHVVSALGAGLTTSGVLNAQEATTAVGAVMTLLSIAWAVYDRRSHVQEQINERLHFPNGR